MAVRRSALLLCPTLFAIALAGLLPATSVAKSPYLTHIVISLRFPAFHGTLTAGKSACERSRAVKLFRRKPGPDKLLGTDESNAKAEWAVPLGKKLPSGSYYVKAPIKGRCRAAKSKVLTIP